MFADRFASKPGFGFSKQVVHTIPVDPVVIITTHTLLGRVGVE